MLLRYFTVLVGKEITWCIFDENPAIISYNSEDVKIPYMSPLDNKVHRYHIDFYIIFKTKSGNTSKALIEIKPFGQTQLPKKGRKHQRTYLNECSAYLINQAKWSAAKLFAEKHDCIFTVITEKSCPALLK